MSMGRVQCSNHNFLQYITCMFLMMYTHIGTLVFSFQVDHEMQVLTKAHTLLNHMSDYGNFSKPSIKTSISYKHIFFWSQRFSFNLTDFPDHNCQSKCLTLLLCLHKFCNSPNASFLSKNRGRKLNISNTHNAVSSDPGLLDQPTKFQYHVLIFLDSCGEIIHKMSFAFPFYQTKDRK